MTADTLRTELDAEYDISEATYSIGERPLHICSVADSYALLDRLSPEEFAKDEQMPYWAEIWPASIVLSKFIFDELRLEGHSCIEMGAGVGVVSIAAAMAGGTVLATDYSSEALRFIKLNALLNQVELDVATLDWRLVTLPDKYDYLFAADVLYERRNQLPILNAIDKLLSKTGRAFIADPRRQIAQGFVRMAEENGFVVSSTTAALQVPIRQLSIDIHELRRA
ncbi:MAG: methyltransferase domain-containing protein [Chlorobiales bacterium]|jgi:predicted nicotinamide N-methyase|nr:methyltransferase domain-containing protein [Chlorobiales bacterium]